MCDADGDPDMCLDDQRICDSSTGEIVCDDLPALSLDLCDGVDDDCDPASADGAEDPGVEAPCDGPDSDLCMEGLTSCSGGVLVCGDTTGSTLDLCNGSDDDCDPTSADGSEDPTVGVSCDNPDPDLCVTGTSVCLGGAVLCKCP